MDTVVEVTDILFAIFAVMCNIFAVLGFLSYLEYTRHYQKSKIQPYYAFEHLRFANKYHGDAQVYGFMAVLSGLLAILMAL